MSIHMIPEQPRDFSPESHEGVFFEALKNNYKGTEEYYVFHSYEAMTVNKKDNVVDDREVDFVVLNQKKGVLCIEVKAGGHIYYSQRRWYYGSGIEMSHGGPYNQARTAARVIREKVQNDSRARVRDIANHCKFLSAVCFVDMQKKDISSQNLPEDASIDVTITSDDLDDIWSKIESIYELKVPSERYSDQLSKGMNDGEFKLLVDAVFCPEFHLIPSQGSTLDIVDVRLKQMIREQYMLLDFLDEQPVAVINGAAGTGKTMIATEKARRNSLAGDKVLFLCYNKKLQKQLAYENKADPDFKNVDFCTLSKLAKDKTGNFQDYNGLTVWLDKCIRKEEKLGYDHIIVDEGQDFGVIGLGENDEKDSEGLENCDIINKLQDAALEQGGTFYLFYDKYQMIQGGQKVDSIFPDCIENADCRLTLHKNCRNTEEIAKTSVTPIRDNRGRLLRVDPAFSWTKVFKPVFHVVGHPDAEIAILNNILDQNKSDGISDTVILSQGALEYSVLKDHLVNKGDYNDPYDYYRHGGKEYRVATCITFKGLEADAIVILNLDKYSFSGEKGNEFYVGTSRAKCKLDMICCISSDDYYNVVSQIDPDAPDRSGNKKAMKKILGNVFSADVIEEEVN